MLTCARSSHLFVIFCILAGAIVQEDENTLKSILAEIKPQIDGLNEQIAEKREKHDQLQQAEV